MACVDWQPVHTKLDTGAFQSAKTTSFESALTDCRARARILHRDLKNKTDTSNFVMKYQYELICFYYLKYKED